jgi:hypothetical protein|tara:strand:- start:356 stop:625 length:270 start_codon:yes stop_codon:yes gene_type:complete
MAKTDVTFIFDIVDKNIRNNPKGLVDKENALLLENYLKKFTNTKGDNMASIIQRFTNVAINKGVMSWTNAYSTLFTIKEFSNKALKISK